VANERLDERVPFYRGIRALLDGREALALNHEPIGAGREILELNGELVRRTAPARTRA